MGERVELHALKLTARNERELQPCVFANTHSFLPSASPSLAVAVGGPKPVISRRRPDGRRRLPSHAKPRLVGRSVARSGGKWGPAAEDAAAAAAVTFAIDGISDEERERGREGRSR